MSLRRFHVRPRIPAAAGKAGSAPRAGGVRRGVARATVAAVGLTLGAGLLVSAGSPAGADPEHAGTITTGAAPSAALGEDIAYNVYLPYGYEDGTDRYPTLYLLHGRGDTMQAWTQVKGELDSLIEKGDIDPVVVIMPDAPWSERGSWYVDSQYTGADDPGRPVETALVHDLVSYVDATYRTVADRSARGVGGYSMGGFGALRFTLAHQDVFSAALVLSPAVYTPLPPADSSTRDYGAFGVGDDPFVDERYQELNYPALLPEVDPALPVHLFIAVGDDEYVNPNPEDALHDLDTESALLYAQVKRTAGITAEFRVLNGGHDWDVWKPAFVEGVQDLFKYLTTVPAAPLTGALLGTAGDDRAGGIVPAADGSATIALAAAGSIDGQPYAGALDAVVTHRDPAGATTWTTEVGTTGTERVYGLAGGSDGEVYAAGYSNGDFDGAHPGSAIDDAFVMRINADGTVAWRTQFGDPTLADRAYAAVAAPGGGAYVAGYTKGSIGGVPSAGDKDVFVAYVNADGTLVWTDQLGSVGEDKGLAVTVGLGGRIYVAGVAGGALPGAASLGASDGWLGSWRSTGERLWIKQVGSSGSDQLAGLAPRAPHGAYATGQSAGDIESDGLGGDDIVAYAFGAAGKQHWSRHVGSSSDDRGADLALRPDGDVELAGFTNGRVGTPAGGFDVVTATLSAHGGHVLTTAQFGTSGNDGADEFGEENLFLAHAGEDVWATGLTYGSTKDAPNHGAGDVFAFPLDLATGLPE